MPSKVQAKNSAEISYPRLHLNHKEPKKTFLTSRLTSCKRKTITQTFRFASPSGQPQQVAAGWCTRKWLRFEQTISNFTSRDLGISLVAIQLGVIEILYQQNHLTNILANIFQCLWSVFGKSFFNQLFHSYQTAPTYWVKMLAQFVPVCPHNFINRRFYHRFLVRYFSK